MAGTTLRSEPRLGTRVPRHRDTRDSPTANGTRIDLVSKRNRMDTSAGVPDNVIVATLARCSRSTRKAATSNLSTARGSAHDRPVRTPFPNVGRAGHVGPRYRRYGAQGIGPRPCRRGRVASAPSCRSAVDGAGTYRADVRPQRSDRNRAASRLVLRGDCPAPVAWSPPRRIGARVVTRMKAGRRRGARQSTLRLTGCRSSCSPPCLT
jgi:hypothetical protein